ncbi:MAG: aminopeptidase [Clostridia bacterium]|nr:aminopeptidase [Clostridia bacterium]MDD4386848.1 aminopeptidase [Clostridia bacterium]
MSLKYEKKNVYENLSKEEISEMNEYISGYVDFLGKAKTEYKSIEIVKEMLEKEGFVDISKIKELKLLDKVYFVNNEKSLYAAVIGKDKLVNGLNIIGAHVDSPRIDLKPMPLYENKGVALLKTQYYGGIKKYQWLAIPLAMHAVMYTSEGKKLDIVIGEDEKDPCFTISDLLPHLSKDQMKVNANEFIDPEKMSILFGSIKSTNEEKEKNDVKENILKILNDRYGIKEIDFARSEIQFVPAFKPRYLGMDSSMIGGYGQDDRVCAYATVKAMISESKNEVNKTMVAMIVDKEEIGSIGNTSMKSNIFDMFINKMLTLKNETGTDIYEVYYNSKMLSADVSTCVDPCYEEFSDIQNSNILGFGVCLEKYTGSGGKYNSSDANAKYVSEVMSILDKNKIIYQLGTLGKIDKGGGGTIAYILANKGVDVIDCGTPVLSMHSPFEVAGVGDIYMTYKAYIAFFK